MNPVYNNFAGPASIGIMGIATWPPGTGSLDSTVGDPSLIKVSPGATQYKRLDTWIKQVPLGEGFLRVTPFFSTGGSAYTNWPVSAACALFTPTEP